MKIVSDNPELLEELQIRFKVEGIVATPKKTPTSKTDKGILEDIIQLIIENPEESMEVIEYVLNELNSLRKQEHIYIISKDGKRIPYAIYKTMTLEEKSRDIF